MNDSEKVKMFLNIGDQRITLKVPFDRQGFVRDVEAAIDRLYRRWRRQFPKMTDHEILAMVAYQYASFYGELNERYEAATAKAEQCLRDASPEAEETAENAEDDDFIPDLTV